MQRVVTAGIILVGGRSSRMGLQKAWVEWGDSTLLQRTVNVMTAATDRVVVVRSGGQELPPVPGSAWVVDDEHPRRGPLQGMLSGMRALGDRAAVAFVCAVDMPFLDERFAVAVLGALTPDADAAVARLDGRAQPLAAAYRLSIAGEIETLLAHGRRRVDELLGTIAVRWLDAGGLPGGARSLRNLNTPADLAAARQTMLQKRSGADGPDRNPDRVEFHQAVRGAEMTDREWVDAFAAALGTPAPDDAEFSRLLELAGVAAHASQRTAAPVACWLAARSGRGIDEVLAMARDIRPESP